MYSITENDFNLLWNTAMAWGPYWDKKKDRFEEIDKEQGAGFSFSYKWSYWFNDNYALILFAKMFLTSKNESFDVLWDLNTKNFVIITDYHFERC